MVDITNDAIMILVIIMWLTLVIILSLCQKTQPNNEYNASEYLGYVARLLLLCFCCAILRMLIAQAILNIHAQSGHRICYFLSDNIQVLTSTR